MAAARKRIIGRQAKGGPAIQVYFPPKRRKPRHALWCLLALIIVPLGAWIDATINLPVFGAAFVLTGWRLWRNS